MDEATTVRVVAYATPSLVGAVVKPWNTAISDTTAPKARL